MMDLAERELLAATVLDALGRVGPGDAAATDTSLHELGWAEMLATEPTDAVALVFEALGATNAPPTVLDDVLAAALGLDPDPARAVLLPAFGTWDPSGAGGSALATARLARATEVVVVRGEVATARAALVPVDALVRTAVHGVDPEGHWHTVQVPGEVAVTADLGPVPWDELVIAGRRAVGHAVAGACRTMLATAREHALTREQFGRPVARFQAVRHRLAEAFVAVETLDATLAAAWEEPGVMTALLAKAWAGRAVATVGTHCQQVLAGIGFTTEHPFHRYLKRTMVLDGVLGAGDDLVVAIGHELLATRAAPTLVEL